MQARARVRLGGSLGLCHGRRRIVSPVEGGTVGSLAQSQRARERERWVARKRELAMLCAHAVPHCLWPGMVAWWHGGTVARWQVAPWHTHTYYGTLPADSGAGATVPGQVTARVGHASGGKALERAGQATGSASHLHRAILATTHHTRSTRTRLAHWQHATTRRRLLADGARHREAVLK